MKAYRARHSIQLVVADLVVTEAFYAGILELPVQRPFTSPGAPDHLVLDLGGVAIVFVEEGDVVRTHPVLEHRLGLFPRGTGVTLHFEVEDIEGISDAIQEEDLEILYPLEIKPYGIKEMWCFDPDGYLVVLDEPVKKRKAG
ncbi:glyoxalase/bleomycin resistance/extradiol dioxygenase family protein [Geobacter sp. SVR]|uniref:VOC family protein n=1 Tax=Geobacter sp. SVR TaxID=2495594 RepID=UPI00143EFFC7|nr:VOC family protein [Geobacter sp. SVR]BCS53958.1 glyoxalase [Geobacter sp. SVR]GCF86261.1 glyoxalase [Geobacter sp. SVR]